jgi:hypothetical protein
MTLRRSSPLLASCSSATRSAQDTTQTQPQLITIVGMLIYFPRSEDD